MSADFEAPECWVPCEHGGVCTLPTDHDGDHEAHSTDGSILCAWPRRPDDRREGLIEGVVNALDSILGDL